MSDTPYILAVTSELCDFAILSADLADVGVDIRRAESLLEALLRQADSPPCVIVCDTEGLDWTEALWTFQQFKRPGAVVFLTRLADERLWIQMLEAGAFDLIEKPYRRQDLRWVVTNALKRRSIRSSAAAA